MLFRTPSKKALTASLFCLVFAATSNATTSDIPCPKGSQHSFVQNSYLYDAPLHKFTEITGSFFNESWYAGTVITNTTGKDNVPGATRLVVWGGIVFTETLVMHSASPDGLISTMYSVPLTHPPTGKHKSKIMFANYGETQRYQSICGGRATYIDVLTYMCSDNPRAAYDLWYRVHQTTFDTLSARFGVNVFMGNCPRE
ncbi:hypothetical protein C8J57DRAFT_1667967 [Mycena rebaudengoi]|nr:hypothetical protein C8J57DRAFT_1667967 [Mycena rebaudengoi]